MISMGDGDLAREESASSSSGLFTLVVVLLALLVLTVHACWYLPFISDDALISLQYAKRLLQGHGLTWSDGPRVEGYTNLLWILCCAGLGALGAGLIVATRILGLIGMGAAVIAVAGARGLKGPGDFVARLAGGLALALAGPIAVWAIGGLEQPLLAALLAWASVLCFPLLEEPQPDARRTLLPGLLLGLVCLTRSDGAVLCVALGLGLLAATGIRRSSITTLLRLAAFPFLFTLGQLIFRLVYYGEWLPNPAFVRMAFTKERLLLGVTYLTDSRLYLAGLWIPAAVGVAAGLFVKSLRRRVLLLFVATLVWCAYVAVVGGDIFPARRQLVPAVVWAALLFSLVVRSLAAERRPFAGPAWAFAAVMLAALGWFQWKDPENRRALRERWEWDGQVVGNLLRCAFGDAQPLLACDAAGCLPYFSGLPAIDMLGVNDRHIARTRLPRFGTGPLSHELGDGEYVLARKPDLIIFGVPRGQASAKYLSGRQMQADPDFLRLYRLVFFEGRDPYRVVSCIWVRADSEKIGIEREAASVIVPGYFLASSEHTTAQVDETGSLVAVIPQGRCASLESLQLEPGAWRLTVGVDARAAIDVTGLGPETARGFDDVRFSLAGEPSVAISVQLTAPPDRAARVRQLLFERVDR
jgi:arabinofuranosyltransferase